MEHFGRAVALLHSREEVEKQGPLVDLFANLPNQCRGVWQVESTQRRVSTHTIMTQFSLSVRTSLAAVGWVLSVYAVYVEYKMEHNVAQTDQEFTALCDIEAIGASCSKVFTLPQGKLLSYFGIIPRGHVLDVPNAMLGVFFYAQQLLLPVLPSTLNKLIVSAAFASTVFLAIQLTFVLGDLCILCWSTHIINSIFFYQTVIAERWGGAKQKAA